VTDQPLHVAGVDIGGFSLGGMRTCIDLPAWKLCMDLGACSQELVRRPTVLFTHAHIDHMGAVASHAATRALLSMRPPTYLVPRPNVPAVEDLFAAWRRLDGSEMPHELVPLEPGEEFALPNGLVARPFRSPHRTLCQGYGLWRKERRLRPELAGLPQEEVRRRRVELGEEVETLDEIPELAFTGDTTIEVVEREEVVRTARVLVIESTFLDDRVPASSARERGHVHLDELIERADLFENEAIVLTHFSARYRAEEVRAILSARLPPALSERVVPLLKGHPR